MTYTPVVKRNCSVVANVATRFQGQTQVLVAQLSSFDFDRSAADYPEAVAKAMQTAESSRFALLKALHDFETRCGALADAARTIAA